MPTLEKIAFVDTDPQAVIDFLVTNYQALTGKRLQPAQVERIQINSAAYRISLLLNAINEAANQCMVPFAIGSALELLGEIMGVSRLPASAALCTLRFTLVAGHSDFFFASGMRVQSVDGQAVFITTEEKTVAVDDTYIDLKCECTKTGIIGNGYTAGNVNIILDPRPYVSTAANLDTTAGGADNESDEALRARILLAPSQFSVAGPKGAYKFWALTAHPTIVDVAVTIGHDPDNVETILGGQVDIFPLLVNNATPSDEIIDAVYAICNDEKIRPLTDTVVVKSPTAVDYAIEVDLIILDDGDADAIQADATAKLQAYVDARKNKLGIDAVKSQLISVAQVNNVYSVELVSPVADVVANESSFTNCTGITVNVVGTHDN